MWSRQETKQGCLPGRHSFPGLLLPRSQVRWRAALGIVSTGSEPLASQQLVRRHGQLFAGVPGKEPSFRTGRGSSPRVSHNPVCREAVARSLAEGWAQVLEARPSALDRSPAQHAARAPSIEFRSPGKSGPVSPSPTGVLDNPDLQTGRPRSAAESMSKWLRPTRLASKTLPQ